jgi:hypothetical protein
VKVRPPVIAASAILVLAALLLVPAGASAAEPVLEFVVPGHTPPVGFTTEGGEVDAEMEGFESLVHCTASHGKGQITGPRTAVAEYQFTGCSTQRGSHQKCKSTGANEEEIKTGSIDAELVWLNQAKREVAILLNPGGGVYMVFECGGESAEGRGPFLAPVTPVNKEATSFTTTLSQLASVQAPGEYEGAKGEKLKAIPEGRHGTSEWVTTGVESVITVHPSFSGEIRAITAAEIETAQHEEEATATAKKHEEEAAKKKQEEEAAAAAAKKRQEEEAAAAAAKKREEEALAALKAAVSRALKARGKAAKIGALLKHGGLTLAFTSSEPGALVIQWWQVPPGAHLAKNGKPKPTLVARGGALFSGAGVGRVKIGLTREGRRLLAHANKLKLTTRVGFTPTGHPTVGASGLLTLRR